MDIRSIRRFLGLRLIDVANATGVNAGRVSLAERGLTRLSPAEHRAVVIFFARSTCFYVAARRIDRRGVGAGLFNLIEHTQDARAERPG
jgi:transcriptional regulator with XRE-family HTH domain